MALTGFSCCQLLTACQDPEAFEQEYAALAVPQAQVRSETVKKSVAVEGEGEDEDDFTHVGKGGKTIQYTAEGIYKTLQAIQEARGKKVSPRQSQLTQRTEIFIEH
jgi:translation initiation factor 3 subunit C